MTDDLEVSVVLPCLNEEDAIGGCINKVKDCLAREKIKGEIIVADNGSTDNSVEIARSLGARIAPEPRKGYGSAYLRGIAQAQGRYIIMADSDNTYDLGDIPAFLEKLRQGCGLVIGSRFKGKINKGAMSWSHRYIGNPILSGMCRLFFNTKLSDIHCGMRGISAEAFRKMRLRTLGMEFATEMVVSALQNNIKTCEIPITYYPREGYSKLKALPDAWRHIRFMLLYCPAWLYLIPGLVGFVSGIFLMVFLILKGTFLFLGHRWDVHLAVFASAMSILSYQVLNLGIYAHNFAITQRLLKPDKFTLAFQRHFTLERGLLLGASLFLAGFITDALIVAEWFSKHFGPLYRIRESVFAMTLLVIGLQTIFSSFFISLLFLKRKHS